MLKKSKDYFYLGGFLLFISVILYFIKGNERNAYLGFSDVINVNYIEMLLWSMFFALIGFQSIIIGSLKKDE
ncbi:hypothetical protein [Haloplasma contractile]|uniref:Uncharacterized protein n=1 Tax=Haloplasma contractile SSD-17B TaxID=1033810 RepID=U2E893_9MOLU|nr:hypothetical protein [Haloplasma contractile]ERJ11408.1 hypothetical protein HLPCO_002530 [Haloplasma contractile SSD-17B]